MIVSTQHEDASRISNSFIAQFRSRPAHQRWVFNLFWIFFCSIVVRWHVCLTYICPGISAYVTSQYDDVCHIEHKVYKLTNEVYFCQTILQRVCILYCACFTSTVLCWYFSGKFLQSRWAPLFRRSKYLCKMCRVDLSSRTTSRSSQPQMHISPSCRVTVRHNEI